MSIRRHNAKRDANEREIVEALRAAGASVWLLDQPVDLLIGYRGKNHIAEVKLPRGQLNDNQRQFYATWRGATPPILRTVDDALALLEGWQ
jgi:hypothetical protein